MANLISLSTGTHRFHPPESWPFVTMPMQLSSLDSFLLGQDNIPDFRHWSTGRNSDGTEILSRAVICLLPTKSTKFHPDWSRHHRNGMSETKTRPMRKPCASASEISGRPKHSPKRLKWSIPLSVKFQSQPQLLLPRADPDTVGGSEPKSGYEFQPAARKVATDIRKKLYERWSRMAWNRK